MNATCIFQSENERRKYESNITLKGYKYSVHCEIYFSDDKLELLPCNVANFWHGYKLYYFRNYSQYTTSRTLFLSSKLSKLSNKLNRFL